MFMEQRRKVLIVDDTELNRALLADILAPIYETIEASSGVEAVAILGRQCAEISLVLLDIVMPDMDGFEVLSMMNRNNWLQNIPVIMISAEAASTYVDHAYDLGATDYITRPFDEKTVMRRVQNTIMLYAKQQYLENLVTEQIMEKERTNSQMVEILSNIVEFRNGESGLHVLHIRVITNMLLQSLQRRRPEYGLTASRIALITNASALHDIGKISIDEKILNKPGRLTPEEFGIMKTHTVIGAQILENSPFCRESELMQVSRDICRWHHERYDGRGYPDGLSGDEIPIGAQVVAMADVYDALISKRVYKPAHSHAKAIEMILNGECGAFNPILLDCLLENAEKLKTDLGLDSPGTINRLDMQRVASEIISRGELQISSRTLALLEQERAKYSFYASMAKEILFEYDRDTGLLEFSAWGAEYLNVPELIPHPEENATILSWGDRSLREMKDLLAKATPSNSVVSRNYCLNLHGETHWFRILARPLWSDEQQGPFTKVIGKLMDINDEQLKMAELKELARKDSLTALYNQAAIRDMVQRELSARKDRRSILMLMDLDSFKTVNDQHGRAFGDDLLKHVAQNIQGSIRENDLAGRIGGDEFLVFMDYGDDPQPLARRVFDAVSTRLDGTDISVSIGVSLCPEDGSDFDTLLYRADLALNEAKRAGKRRYVFYTSDIPDIPDALRRTPIEGSEATV